MLPRRAGANIQVWLLDYVAHPVTAPEPSCDLSILLRTVFAVESADQDTLRIVLVQEHFITSEVRVVAGAALRLYEHATMKQACSKTRWLAWCLEESGMVRNHDSFTSAEGGRRCAN